MGIPFLPEPPWPRIRGQNLCPAACLTWTSKTARRAVFLLNGVVSNFGTTAKEVQIMLDSS